MRDGKSHLLVSSSVLAILCGELLALGPMWDGRGISFRLWDHAFVWSDAYHVAAHDLTHGWPPDSAQHQAVLAALESPLWCLLVAAPSMLGAHPEVVSVVLGHLFLAAAVLGVTAWSRAMLGEPPERYAWLAPWVLVLSANVPYWTASGMETTLVLAALAWLGFSLQQRPGGLAPPLLAGVVAMSRPEGVLVALAGAVMCARAGSRTWTWLLALVCGPAMFALFQAMGVGVLRWPPWMTPTALLGYLTAAVGHLDDQVEKLQSAGQILWLVPVMVAGVSFERHRLAWFGVASTLCLLAIATSDTGLGVAAAVTIVGVLGVQSLRAMVHDRTTGVAAAMLVAVWLPAVLYVQPGFRAHRLWAHLAVPASVLVPWVVGRVTSAPVFSERPAWARRLLLTSAVAAAVGSQLMAFRTMLTHRELSVRTVLGRIERIRAFVEDVGLDDPVVADTEVYPYLRHTPWRMLDLSGRSDPDAQWLGPKPETYIDDLRMELLAPKGPDIANIGVSRLALNLHEWEILERYDRLASGEPEGPDHPSLYVARSLLRRRSK